MLIVCQKSLKLQYLKDIKIVLWHSTQIVQKLQKAWWTTIVMEVLKALDASMGVQTANICCLWRIVALIHRFVRNINCVLSTKLHKYHRATWLGHHRAFQGVIQAAPGTESCVLYGPRNGHWTEIILQAHTFYVSGLATLHTVDNCELFSSVWLWVWS